MKRENGTIFFVVSLIGFLALGIETPQLFIMLARYHGQFLGSVDISIDGYFQWQIYLRKVCSHTPGRNF